jgi:acyl-CoA thioester hydrolase
VRWGDMDALDYVKNTILFSCLEEARIQYLNKIGIKKLMTEYGLGFVVAFIDCKFILSLTYPDTVYIGTRITEISANRFTFCQVIYNGKHQKIAGKNQSTIVSYIRKISTSKSFP